jgi:hypothetical protein
MGTLTHLAMTFEEWTLLTTDAQLLGTLRTQSANLRSGSIDAQASWCAVKAVLPDASPAPQL